MAMQEQERLSLPLETARTASNEPQLPGLGPATGRSAAAMATGAMAGSGAGVEGERGPEGDPNEGRSSSSPWAALLSFVGSQFQRRPRSNVPRAAPSIPWGSKLLPAVLPPAPAQKKTKKKSNKQRPGKCAICEKTETPLWRTLPTDKRVMLCNACGIQARAPGAVLPKLLHLLPPAPATETLTATTLVSEQEEPPAEKIQGLESPPESPISDSESDSTMEDPGVYMLKRRSPPRENPPPPPPPTESAPAAATAAPDNKADKAVTKSCQHCGNKSSLQWRKGPKGPSTLCNPCGVRFRQGRLVPEYRPKASPIFNQSEHSHKHRDVLQLRAMLDHPAPPAAFQPCGTRKRRNGKEQQRQVRKKHEGSNKEHNDQQPAAQPAAMAALQVRKKSNKGKEQHRGPPQLVATATQPRAGDDMVRQHHLPPPPPPPALLPHAGDGMVRQEKLPPPPPAQPHTGNDMAPYLDLPPALLRAYEMKMEQDPTYFTPVPPGFEHVVVQPTPAKNTLAPPRAGDEMAPQYLVPTPAPELPHAADDMEMEEHNQLHFPPVPPGFEHLVVQPTPPAAKEKVTTKMPAKKQTRLPEQVTTVVVSEEQAQEQAPSQVIHESESPPDSPILESMLHLNVYLLKRTSPRRDKSPRPPPTAAGSSAPVPAPDEKDKPVKCCVHCASTWSLQWRSGPAGPSTLCNACGLRHREDRLVPEYRPRASPTFNPAEHSNKHSEVLQLRAVKDNPAPPAKFQPSGNRRRRNGTELQHQPAQVGNKKRKGSKEHNDQPAQPAAVVLQVHKKSKGTKEQNDHQPANPAAAMRAVLQVHKKSKGTKEQNDQPAQPAAVVLQVHKKSKCTKKQNDQPAQPAAAVLQVHKKSKGKAQRLPPEPALLKLHKKHKGREQRRGAPQPVDAGDDMVQQHHLPPLPPVLLPHAGNVMVRQQLLPPPPPPAQPHAGYGMVRYLPLPPALLHAGDRIMQMEHHHQLLLPPPALPHAGDEMVQQHLPAATPPELPRHAAVEMEQHLLPPLPAQLHAIDELMMGVPIPPMDPLLFDEPAAPRIINDDEPTVIVIDDD